MKLSKQDQETKKNTKASKHQRSSTSKRLQTPECQLRKIAAVGATTDRAGVGYFPNISGQGHTTVYPGRVLSQRTGGLRDTSVGLAGSTGTASRGRLGLG